MVTNSILTKNIIENASGIKMWQSLRQISDCAVKFKIRNLMNERHENENDFQQIDEVPILDIEDVIGDLN